MVSFAVVGATFNFYFLFLYLPHTLALRVCKRKSQFHGSVLESQRVWRSEELCSGVLA